MEINLTTNDVYKRLSQALELELSYSLLRIGDGEAILLSGFDDRARLNKFFIKQFGYILEDKHVEEIINNLIEAYENCSLIGIPTKLHTEKIGGYWKKASELLKEKVKSIKDRVEYCSIDVHTDMLKAGCLDELLKQVDSVYYISCRDLNEGFKRKYPNIKNVHSYIIAPESVYTPDYVGKKHYPEQFNEIKEWINSLDNLSGKLCIIGAGCIGKIYSNWFANKGAVSVDLGNVLDLWYGKITRGPQRGAQSFNDLYKL